MRVMVTGGTGFVGSHTVRQFLAQGHSLRLLVRDRKVAAAEATHSASEYLLGTPLLADYLEDGLEAMGFSVEEAEER